jgi:hypothetical protein
MAAPDLQMDLGTAALEGADGDTARAAATKYNTHVHQTTDVQAAIDGAAAPAGGNVFATMADVGGGGGLSISQLSVTTGSIAAMSSDEVEITGLPSDNILILQATIQEVGAGGSTGVSAEIWNIDGVSDWGANPAVTGGTPAKLMPFFGENFLGLTIATAVVYGPQIGFSSPFPHAAVPFHDLEGTQKLYLKVYNEDATFPGTFEIKIRFVDVGAFT